jgi:hypothetical protein
MVIVAASLGAAAPAADPSAKPADDRQVINVKTAEELIQAIGPERIILLQQGEYNLSKVKRAKLKHVRWTSPMDGQYQVEIRDVPHLSIRGDGNQPSHVLVNDPYAFVLTFENAPHLELSNMRIGHSPQPGYCSGGVVQLLKTAEVKIDRCILYGCGMEGLHLERVSKLTLADSVIEDCTYGILTANDCEELKFVGSTFRKVIQYYGFDLQDCTGVSFTGCKVVDNIVCDGTLFKTNLQSEDGVIRFAGGQITGNVAAGLVNEKGMLKVTDANVSANSWQAPAQVIKLRGTKVARAGGGWTYHVDLGDVTIDDVARKVYEFNSAKDVEESVARLKNANPGLPAILRPDIKIIVPPVTTPPPAREKD